MSARAAVAAAALLLVAAPRARAADSPPSTAPLSSTLVSYGFDDGNIATGPDTFAVFEKARGRVHLSSAFRTSGYRAVEIRDVAGDGNFPELQGYFPKRDTGILYAHFALLVTNPEEQLNIALAGPEWFTLRKGGVAFWLQTRGGWLWQYSDSMPVRLFQVRPFTWYATDVAYDVAAGTYDLSVREEGKPETIVALKAQPNAVSEPGSPVDKFSFIGDNGHDTSNVDYYVDDILLTVDRPIPLAPFVAPGRRKLFFDTWRDAQTLLRSKPVCLPSIDLEDFGADRARVETLEREGLLPVLEALIDGSPVTLPDRASPGSRALMQAVLSWKGGCAALQSGDADGALERFTRATEASPRGVLFEASTVLALAALGRGAEADVRLASLHGAWADDPRLPLLVAMIGLARSDLDGAERPLRASAARVADDPRLECALVALSRDVDRRTVEMLRKRFPSDWRTCLDAALLPEEYFHVLLARGATSEAGRYATRMADRLRAMKLDASPWIERAGDASFLEGDYPRALARYRDSTTAGAPDVALMLKLSDVNHLLGDVAGERAMREAIYGSLHEEADHPEDRTPAAEKPPAATATDNEDLRIVPDEEVEDEP